MATAVVSKGGILNTTGFDEGEILVVLRKAEYEKIATNARFYTMLDERHKEIECGEVVTVSADELRALAG